MSDELFVPGAESPPHAYCSEWPNCHFLALSKRRSEMREFLHEFLTTPRRKLPLKGMQVLHRNALVSKRDGQSKLYRILESVDNYLNNPNYKEDPSIHLRFLFTAWLRVRPANPTTTKMKNDKFFFYYFTSVFVIFVIFSSLDTKKAP